MSALDDSLVRLLGAGQEALQTQEIRRRLLAEIPELTVSQVNSRLYALQKTSKQLERIQKESESAPYWQWKMDDYVPVTLPKSVPAPPKISLGSRWPSPEGPFHEVKGAKEENADLFWSPDDFRRSFNRHAGRTLVAFLNSRQQQQPKAPEQASVVFGIYHQSRQVHGVWIDRLGKDAQGSRPPQPAQLERAMR